MTQNFSNAKIYKITNDYNEEVYVGSTCDTLIKRYSGHKSKSKNEKYMNIPLYKAMNEKGIERFRIDLVEDYPCNDKQALRQREGYWIRNNGTLNIRIEDRTQKEYEEQNKDKIKERIKEYHIDNKEKIKEKSKSYYEANKEKIKECEIEYRKQNKEKIREKKKEYQEQNKEKIKEKKKKYEEQNKDKIKEKKREYYQKKKLEKQQLNI